MKINGITENFEKVEITKEYDEYYYSICGLKNISQIQQWARNDRISEFLREQFAIERVPC